MKFIFSRPSLQDVAEIGNWIARDDPVRADRFVEEIRTCCQDLCAYPLAYPILEDFPRQGVRHRVFGRYVICYRIERDRVIVIAVLNGARDVTAILRKRLG